MFFSIPPGKRRKKNSIRNYRNFLGIIKDEEISDLVGLTDEVGINHNAATAAKESFLIRVGKFFKLRKGIKPTLKSGKDLLEHTNDISRNRGKG